MEDELFRAEGRMNEQTETSRKADMTKLFAILRTHLKTHNSVYKSCAQPGRTKLFYKSKFLFTHLLNSHQPDGMKTFPKRLSVLYILKCTYISYPFLKTIFLRDDFPYRVETRRR
jgi:hypothetical protein